MLAASRSSSFRSRGLNRFDFSSLHEEARLLTFFLTPDLRSGYDAGRVEYLPMHMRHIFDYLAAGPLDMALIQCTRDAQGVLRAGPNVDFHAAALNAAKTVVAELNNTLPAPAGAPVIDESAIDYWVESDNGPVVLPAATPDAVARAIGAHVASLIQDGDCIQTGIGAIPAAILAALATKNDIGLHGGLLDDRGRALIEAGVANGAAKTHMQGKHVTGMLVGSSQLFEWAACRDDVVLVGADVTHESRTIALIDNFVSINSAVEVDLDGPGERRGGGRSPDLRRWRRGRLHACSAHVARWALHRRHDLDGREREGVPDCAARQRGHGVAHGRRHRGHGIRDRETARPDAGRPRRRLDCHRTPGFPRRVTLGNASLARRRPWLNVDPQG